MRLFYSPKYKNQFYEVPYNDGDEINEDLDYTFLYNGSEAYWDLIHPDKPKLMTDEDFLAEIDAQYMDLILRFFFQQQEPEDKLEKVMYELNQLGRKAEDPTPEEVNSAVMKANLNEKEISFIGLLISDLTRVR